MRSLKLAIQAQYEQALDLFDQHQYAQALALFKDCLAQNPADPILALYIERCQKYHPELV